MKKYVLDQTIFLILGVVLMGIIPFLCGRVFTIVLEVLIILTWGFLCRRTLLLPFDFLLGVSIRTVCFSTQCGIEECEFFKGQYYSEWQFYFSNNQTIKLLNPTPVTKQIQRTITLPKKDEKIRITYFRLSRILINWIPDEE